MSNPRISRRALIAGAAGLGLAGTFGFALPAWRARGSGGGKRPLVIGMTSDASGQYATHGEDDRRGMQLAIDEFNAKGGVLGRPVEFLHQDTGSAPATGARVAERMIARDQVAFLVGAVHSGVANAISQVAQKHGVIFLNTNSSSPSESGRNAHRVKFVWDGNGTNFGTATVKYAIKSAGRRFLLLTNDYVWGHDTAKAYRAVIEANGGTVMKELLVPQNTRDFTSYLLEIQQLAPDVVAAAIGGDDQKVLRTQVAQLKLDAKPIWINNQQDWPDVYGLPAGGLFGTFSTTWYHKLPLPGVAEFVQRYQQRFPEASISVPGNVSYNGYMAVRELLRAVERVGTTNNHALIRDLEQLRIPAAERMQHFDAWMNPATHHLEQTIYMATGNAAPKDSTDLFEILAWTDPEEVRDRAAEAEAAMESFADTPVYEP